MFAGLGGLDGRDVALGEEAAAIEETEDGDLLVLMEDVPVAIVVPAEIPLRRFGENQESFGRGGGGEILDGVGLQGGVIVESPYDVDFRGEIETGGDGTDGTFFGDGEIGGGKEFQFHVELAGPRESDFGSRSEESAGDFSIDLDEGFGFGDFFSLAGEFAFFDGFDAGDELQDPIGGLPGVALFDGIIGEEGEEGKGIRGGVEDFEFLRHEGGFGGEKAEAVGLPLSDDESHGVAEFGSGHLFGDLDADIDGAVLAE